MNCCYYQACVKKSEALFLVATLKSVDHVCFDRALDPQRNVFEFFVPPLCEPIFLAIMKQCERHQIVRDVKKLPNRLMYEEV